MSTFSHALLVQAQSRPPPLITSSNQPMSSTRFPYLTRANQSVSDDPRRKQSERILKHSQPVRVIFSVKLYSVLNPRRCNYLSFLADHMGSEVPTGYCTYCIAWHASRMGEGFNMIHKRQRIAEFFFCFMRMELLIIDIFLHRFLEGLYVMINRLNNGDR